MSYYKPKEIAENTVETGVAKANMSIPSMLALGFAAGAFISIGFLLAIRVTAVMPAEFGGLTTFLSAAVFPVGLILVIIAGGELLTGNMMAVPLAWYARKIKGFQVAKNWFWITFSNFLGALFVAYFFGHVVGLTGSGAFLERTVDLAGHKIHDTFLQAFISGIGCNWLVALAVWLAYSAKDVTGKILGIWFPTMAFVAIGFQHVVANMFLIPAAIFAGAYTWADYFTNFVPVFLGNAVGGAIFVAMIYYVAYLRKGLN
ncbi:formate/nitrite transporter family protein [Paenibacillus sp. N1-5-1-14]|uniref:formate/nitrite transporter family protein n=1 Tax=Paenibacillus radicibacter TaxID=2972488 RepID=UPI002159B382|nr:formate/nitrite transporter family protein [Paenibacillus radicibacter]MCR8645624.1 formate/nitrite transporter family protein [Paenibacillus radicibacter]